MSVFKNEIFKNYSSYHINNCLNLSSFEYLENKSKIKDKWDIPKDKKILTFGAYDIQIKEKVVI